MERIVKQNWGWPEKLRCLQECVYVAKRTIFQKNCQDNLTNGSISWLNKTGEWIILIPTGYYYYYFFSNTRNRFYWVTFKLEDIHQPKFCTITLFTCYYTDFENGEYRPRIGLFTPIYIERCIRKGNKNFKFLQYFQL